MTSALRRQPLWWLPLSAALRVCILRHGQTDHNAAGIIQGASDVSRLTPAGEEQARGVGGALRTPGLGDLRFARTFISPLTRAQQTYALLGSGLPAPTTLHDLREIELHSWQGRRKAELKAEQPEAYAAWQGDPLAMVVDGHRPIVDLWARARAVWPVVRAADGDGDGVTLLMCHGSLGQALLCTALGLDETAWRRHEFPNCGLVEVDWPRGAPRCSRWRWRLPEEEAWQSAFMARALARGMTTIQGGDGESSGTVDPPCGRGCLSWDSSVSNASIDEFPWVRVLQRLPAPLPSDDSPLATRPPRVAVCLAGQARSLIDPAVWRSIRELVLERGRHPLFLVLGTSGESSKLQHADLGAPDACALQHALSALRPRRVRFVLREQPYSCDNPATGQFAKWADCVLLVREEEAAGEPPYEFLFKTRPDILWTARLRVSALAARLAASAAQPVLSGNDWHLLLPRSRWGVLEALRPGALRCDARCAGGPSALREYFDQQNEYCLFMLALAAHGAPHIEASHPITAGIMHHVAGTEAVWTAALRAPAHRIQRQRLQVGNVQRATLCTPLHAPPPAAAADAATANATAASRAFGWRCAYCSHAAAAAAATATARAGQANTAAAERLRPCPAALWSQSAEASAPSGASRLAAPPSARAAEPSATLLSPLAPPRGTALLGPRKQRRLVPRRQAAAAAAAAGFGRLNCSRRPAWRPAHNASAVRRGFCQGTNDDTPCHLFGSKRSMGAWDARVYKLRTLRDCADICRTCAHCYVVSFNAKNNDCSWYRHCDVDRLLLPDSGYRSMRIKEA